jgi:uncharacterized protein (TIGR03067 family)
MNATLLLGLALAVGAPALRERPKAEPSIEGEWKVESRFDDGKPSTDQNLWVFSPRGVAEIRDPTGTSVISHLTYTLSSAGPFKAIDFLESQRNGRAEPRQGLYRIDGDTLTASFTVGDAPRPMSFDPSKEGYVLVLKRVKK